MHDKRAHHRQRRRQGETRTGHHGRGRHRASDLSTIVTVDDARALKSVVARINATDSYALDTEFHREKTYYPQLALIQLAWFDDNHQRLVLVDPTSIDAAELADALGDLLDGPARAIMHAADQDLEILEQKTGTRPARLFDTQLAAGFLGYSTPSLGTLTQSILGVALDKGERLTDWLQRPLTGNQKRYAAGDVAHLHALDAHLRQQLEVRGRLDWAFDACDELRTRPRVVVDPGDAWMRIKETRGLHGEALGAAQSIAAWRERTAQDADIPPRRVLSDLGVVSIAQRLPTSADDLDGLRGLNPGSLGEGRARTLIELVSAGRHNTVIRPRSGAPATGPDKATVAVVNAWLNELARRQQLDPALLGTRGDVERWLIDRTGPLATGWRHRVAGRDLAGLLDGTFLLSVKDGNLAAIAQTDAAGQYDTPTGAQTGGKHPA